MKVTFSPPDQYGEIMARVEMPLSLDKKTQYVELEINGRPAQKYFFDYGDAGTVGYARMQGNYAIGGQLTNVSADWGNGAPEFGILNVTGTISKGMATLYLFKKYQGEALEVSE